MTPDDCGAVGAAADAGQPGHALKHIYLARRLPDVDRDRFVRRWRQHGALGMSMDFWPRTWRRYVHCDVRGEIDAEGRVSQSEYDGIGMLWGNPRGTGQWGASPAERAALLDDEREVFAEHVSQTGVMTAEHTSLGHDVAVSVKLVRLIHWTDGLDAVEAAQAWREHSRSLTRADDSIVRHCVNLVIEPAPAENDMRCDAIDEVGFQRARDLVRYSVATDVTTIAAPGGPLGVARVFAVSEVVLYDTEYTAPVSASAR